MAGIAEEPGSLWVYVEAGRQLCILERAAETVDVVLQSLSHRQPEHRVWSGRSFRLTPHIDAGQNLLC